MNIFPNFQTWIVFFSRLFQQNQKTWKFCTFTSLDLHVIHFWAKKKPFCLHSHFTTKTGRGAVSRFRLGPVGFYSFFFFLYFLPFFLPLIPFLSFLLFFFLFFTSFHFFFLFIFFLLLKLSTCKTSVGVGLTTL